MAAAARQDRGWPGCSLPGFVGGSRIKWGKERKLALLGSVLGLGFIALSQSVFSFILLAFFAGYLWFVLKKGRIMLWLIAICALAGVLAIHDEKGDPLAQRLVDRFPAREFPGRGGVLAF